MIQIGDRVKLVDSVARSWGAAGKKKGYWLKREGTVRAVTKVTGQVGVLWDGNKAIDFWPLRAVEPVKGRLSQ